MLPRPIHLDIVCTEYSIVDALRDLANYIEEFEGDISEIRDFEGDHYEGTLNVEC